MLARLSCWHDPTRHQTPFATSRKIAITLRGRSWFSIKAGLREVCDPRWMSLVIRGAGLQAPETPLLPTHPSDMPCLLVHIGPSAHSCAPRFPREILGKV